MIVSGWIYTKLNSFQAIKQNGWDIIVWGEISAHRCSSNVINDGYFKTVHLYVGRGSHCDEWRLENENCIFQQAMLLFMHSGLKPCHLQQEAPAFNLRIILGNISQGTCTERKSSIHMLINSKRWFWGQFLLYMLQHFTEHYHCSIVLWSFPRFV